MLLQVALFHSFTGGWPVFPAPLLNEIVFSPLYIFVSFVKDKVFLLLLLLLSRFSCVLLCATS